MLGKVLEYESWFFVKLIFMLYDIEGKIEKVGIEYVFGLLDY